MAEETRTTLVVTTVAGFEAAAREELRALLPDAHFRPLFLKGNLLVTTSALESEAAARLRDSGTGAVASAAPVQRVVRLSSGEDPAEAVAAVAAAVGRLRPGETFVVRCRRRGEHPWQARDLERGTAARIAALTGAVGEYERETDWHVTIQVYQDLAYVGVVRPGDMVQKRTAPLRRYAPGERPLNRAQWKLKEAFEAFGIPRPVGRALDLGSAPGGWAAVLAETAREVVAVDPADLDRSVAELPNVRHLRCRAEELAGRPELGGGFELLTCDVNLDPQEAARLVCQAAPWLAPGAWAVMTIKYVTRERRRHEREATAMLAAEYGGIRLRHLPHNAWETTAAMHRRGGKGEAPK